MRVAISLTTIPPRLGRIKRVIYSILRQTAGFDALYLNIPLKSKKGEEYTIPDFIHNISDPRFILNRCERDYGPITKLLPTLEKETDKDTVIICCDDDNLWAPNTLDLFLQNHKKYPGDALSLSGFCIGKFPLYFQLVSTCNTTVCVDWIQGTHGILISRGMLSADALLDYSKFEPGNHDLLSRNDDHWISYNLHINKIIRRKIPGECDKYFIPTFSGRIGAISSDPMFMLNVFKICRLVGIYGISTSFRNCRNHWSLLIVSLCVSVCVSLCVSVCVLMKIIKPRTGS